MHHDLPRVQGKGAERLVRTRHARRLAVGILGKHVEQLHVGLLGGCQQVVYFGQIIDDERDGIDSALWHRGVSADTLCDDARHTGTDRFYAQPVGMCSGSRQLTRIDGEFHD